MEPHRHIIPEPGVVLPPATPSNPTYTLTCMAGHAMLQCKTPDGVLDIRIGKGQSVVLTLASDE